MRFISLKTSLAVAAVLVAAGILAGGSMLRPAAASGKITIHPDALVTCASGGACEEYDNRSTGQAFEGETGKGIGLEGYASKNGTGLYGYSATGLGLYADAADDYNDVYGYYYGLTSYATLDEGLYGAGAEGLVAAAESANPAVEAYADGGDSFAGYSSSDVNVFNVDNGGDVNADGYVAGGDDGDSATGGSFNGEDQGVVGSNLAALDCGCGEQFAVYANGFGGDLFVGNNSDADNVFVVDNSGNETISGLLYTSGFCSSGCVAPDKPGPHVLRYTPAESEPTMEDFGEGQVTSGSGYVHLDAAFARTIDQTVNYMVFITPEGDNRGLYVTNKSAAGFAVRESQGGHSTLAFSWRIVAKPYGISAARLPMVTTVARTHDKQMAMHKAAVVRGTLRHPLTRPQG